MDAPCLILPIVDIGHMVNFSSSFMNGSIFYVRIIIWLMNYKLLKKNFSIVGSNIIIGVNSLGILLIKPDDKFILFEFTYSEIESLLLDPSDDFVTLNLARGPQERQRVYVFETKQKSAIGALVASYCPSIANWVREADAPKRKVKQVSIL